MPSFLHLTHEDYYTSERFTSLVLRGPPAPLRLPHNTTAVVCLDLELDCRLGESIKDYETDDELYDAIHRRLEIIGEAVRHIPQEIRGHYSAVPWKDIAGIRDILIHEYFEVNAKRIWETVINDLPGLAEQVRNILHDTEAKD